MSAQIISLASYRAARQAELEASTPEPRECPHCGRRIPVRRRANAKYCCNLCRELAAKGRREVAHG